MIEHLLLKMIVEQERVVDDGEIHIGDAPIRVPEAGDEERRQHERKHEDELAAPVELYQPIERPGRIG